MPELPDLTAVELVAQYRAKTLSPVEVTEAVVARIEAREPELHALYAYDPSSAREEAKAAEARWHSGEPLGPIDGVPLTLKENIATRGTPVPLGTAATALVPAAEDAPAAARVRESGGVLLAKTTMPDYGMLTSGLSSFHLTARNPWDVRCTPGGSSSGAGAAAAAGYGPLHVGTDIGGSIRLPGPWLGLTPLKPSAGRVPLDAPYLGRAAGPLTRTAADAALLLSVISRPDARDWTSLPPEAVDPTPRPLDPTTLRLGLHLDAGCGTPVEPEIRAAVEEAARVFEGAGATVVPLAPFMRQGWLESLDEFWRVRSLVELDSLEEDARARVLPYVRRWAEGARGLDGTRVLRDYTNMMAIQQATVAATEPFGLVLSPVAPMAAFPAEWPMPWGAGDSAMSHVGFTAPFNLSGQPAGTTNCGFTPDGRTIGLQVSGRRFDDAGVLSALAWFEQHRPDTMTPRWPVHS